LLLPPVVERLNLLLAIGNVVHGLGLRVLSCWRAHRRRTRRAVSRDFRGSPSALLLLQPRGLRLLHAAQLGRSVLNNFI